MKPLLFVVTVMSLLLLSCTKNVSADSVPLTFEGTWKMIAVKDNNTGDITIKPDSVQGDVILTFTVLTDSSGTYSGHTPANEIITNPYSTGTNQQLSIPFLGMSQVAETSWGYEFVDNICQSRQYTFESESKLNIISTSKTLTFQRQ